MNIEKLCEEFHEKIGKTYSLNITIEKPFNNEDKEAMFTGVYYDPNKTINLKENKKFIEKKGTDRII